MSLKCVCCGMEPRPHIQVLLLLALHGHAGSLSVLLDMRQQCGVGFHVGSGWGHPTELDHLCGMQCMRVNLPADGAGVGYHGGRW